MHIKIINKLFQALELGPCPDAYSLLATEEATTLVSLPNVINNMDIVI